MYVSTVILVEGEIIEHAWHEPEPDRVCSLFAGTLPFYAEESVRHSLCEACGKHYPYSEILSHNGKYFCLSCATEKYLDEDLPF